jgi:hypothetical protein
MRTWLPGGISVGLHGDGDDADDGGCPTVRAFTPALSHVRQIFLNAFVCLVELYVYSRTVMMRMAGTGCAFFPILSATPSYFLALSGAMYQLRTCCTLAVPS